jgi:putative ABC transport system permease protein
MLRHTLSLIFRNALRFRSIFVINLIGLSTGLAGSLLIYLWISDELGIDKFHKNDSRLFQAMYHEKTANGIKTTGQTPWFLSAALKNEIPEVEFAATVTPPDFFPDFTITANNKKVKGIGKFADEDFFRMFSYNIIAGNQATVLRDKNSVVISVSLAEKLFNTTDNIIGKPLDYSLLGLEKQVFISGVFKDVPSNASEHLDFVLSFDVIRELMGLRDVSYAWETTDPFYSYIMLKEDASIGPVNNKLQNYIAVKNSSSPFSVFLRPFSDGYLYGKYENGKPDGGRIDYVILFSLIGIFILIIACINFVNLSTAKARTRLKEIGVRKVIGATRKSLIFQYMSETLVLSFLSLVLSIIIVYAVLPQFNFITGKQLSLILDTKLLTAAFVITFSTGLVAGVYPAFYISGLRPVTSLKGQLSGSVSEVLIRKGLVIFQFALCVIFITAVMVIYRQIGFVQSKNLGYQKDNLVYFSADGNISGKADVFLNETNKIPGVLTASSMFGSLTGEGNGLPGFIEIEGKKITMYGIGVNYDMLETLGVTLKQGRSFSRSLDHEADTMKWILNEAAAKAIGYINLVGKTISDREVIGIVKDFHFQSLHEQVKPFAFRLEPHYGFSIWVRIQKGRESEAIESLKKLYASFNPDLPFNYRFLDQAYEAQYISEKRVAGLAKYFAALAITISCLGLFGLAAFTAEKRKKEIGIRKVMGSTEFGIVYLLTVDFTKMVLVAIVISVPLSYIAAQSWLNTFAYAIELRWWYFAAAGACALLIAWLTVGILTLKAAKTNPVSALRCE